MRSGDAHVSLTFRFFKFDTGVGKSVRVSVIERDTGSDAVESFFRSFIFEGMRMKRY